MKNCTDSFDWISHEEYCDEIKGLTEINDHLSAYILGCNYLKTFKNADASYFESILDNLYSLRYKAESNGGLDGKTYEEVRSLYCKMMDAARHILCDEAYNDFYSSF